MDRDDLHRRYRCVAYGEARMWSLSLETGEIHTMKHIRAYIVVMLVLTAMGVCSFAWLEIDQGWVLTVTVVTIGLGSHWAMLGRFMYRARKRRLGRDLDPDQSWAFLREIDARIAESSEGSIEIHIPARKSMCTSSHVFGVGNDRYCQLVFSSIDGMIVRSRLDWYTLKDYSVDTTLATLPYPCIASARTVAMA